MFVCITHTKIRRGMKYADCILRREVIPPPTNVVYLTYPLRAGSDKRSVFERNKVGLNSEFSFSSKVTTPSLPCYLIIIERRTDGFMAFPMALKLSEMQTALSWIWTRVTVSLSIRWLSSNSEDQGSMEYPFIAITPRSTLTLLGFSSI